jgi:hypothetical protein
MKPGDRYYPVTDEQKLGYLVEECGEVLAANKAVACMALDTGGAVLDERATQAARWIICAVNTLSGFKAEIPK